MPELKAITGTSKAFIGKDVRLQPDSQYIRSTSRTTCESRSLQPGDLLRTGRSSDSPLTASNIYLSVGLR